MTFNAFTEGDDTTGYRECPAKKKPEVRFFPTRSVKIRQELVRYGAEFDPRSGGAGSSTPASLCSVTVSAVRVGAGGGRRVGVDRGAAGAV
jgi:hypothetical protein